jgi:hypothetical protein
MAMNVRFNEGFASDPRFVQVMNDAMARIGEAGISTNEFRKALDGFIADVRAGASQFPDAGVALAGFMLGMWLGRKPLVETAA